MFVFLKTEIVRVRVTAGISSQKILWCALSPPFKVIFNFDLIFILSVWIRIPPPRFYAALHASTFPLLHRLSARCCRTSWGLAPGGEHDDERCPEMTHVKLDAHLGKSTVRLIKVAGEPFLQQHSTSYNTSVNTMTKS